MIVPKIDAEICEYLHQLPVEQQQHVLEFVRTLATTRIRGTPGKDLLKFAGTIDKDDLQLMTQAIDEGCEQIHENEW